MTALHVIQGTDGKQLPVGARQASFLIEQGHIKRLGESPMYFAPAHTAQEVHAIVMAYPELRECDFCGETPGGWRLQVAPFAMRDGPLAGIKLGGPIRPIFLCSECAEYTRRSHERWLVDRMVHTRVEQAEQVGLLPRGVAPSRARDFIRPMSERLVADVFEHRIGDPEPD